jgi:hypothetical protein
MKIPVNHREIYQTAFAAGVLGAFSILFFRGAAQMFRLTDLNLGLIIGTALTGQLDGLVYLGFPLEILFFSAFSFLYAVYFIQSERANLRLGAIGGVVQWLICGTLLGLIGKVHPLMPRTVSDPGFFARNAGTFEMIFFFALNVAYGSLVGYFCEPVIRRAHLRQEMTEERRAA